MKNRTLLFFSALLIIALIAIVALFSPVDEKFKPLPYETIIIDEEDDSDHVKKQEWIEMIHRSAPEDNWRYMDQQYRLNNSPEKLESDDLPIYGKWRELGSNNQAGRTVYTYFDDTTEEVYTASDGGQIWKGEIGAENWISLNDHYKIPSIRFLTKFNESGFTRLLVHSGAYNIAGIMYSDDNGLSWTLANGLENIISWGFIKRTVVRSDAGKTIYCISQEWDYNAWQAICRVYKSTDFGASFESITSFDHSVDFVDIWTSQTGETPVYIVAKDELYYLDESDELISISTLPNSENGNTLITGFDSGNGVFLYSMIRFNSLSHFYASGINGDNWLEKGNSIQGPFMVNSFAASIDEQDVLYFGGMEAFTSYNAGSSWTLVNAWGQYYGSPTDKLHADIPSFNSFHNNQGLEYLFINTDGGTYISYNKMDNVENISLNNLRISQYYSSYTCRFDPSFTHAGSQDQGYQKSANGLNEGAIDYIQVISGDYGSMVSGDDGASIWMVYPGFAMYGPDINNNNSLVFGNFVGSNYQWLPKLMEDPNNPENVYLAGGHLTDGAHIILLERNGNNVAYSELPFDFSNGTSANISALTHSKIDTDYWYVLTSEKDFFYSTDGGNAWIQTDAFTGPGSHYFYGASIAAANTSLGLVYAGGAGYSNPGVYKSIDNGETFTEYAEGLPNTMIFQVVLSEDDSLLFAATEVGAFVCKTWEDQWYALSDSVVPDQAFWAVDFVDTLKVARFSTYGRGIWDFELDPDVVADFMADNNSITTNQTVNFMDLSSFSPVSWEWYFEGGVPETSYEQHPIDILYEQTGSFDVRLIVTNDQSTDTVLKENYITVGTVGIADRIDESEIVIYPNPATKSIFVESDKKIDQILLYSRSGELIQSISGKGLTGDILIIDVKNLSKGVYFVKIISELRASMHKIIVQ